MRIAGRSISYGYFFASQSTAIVVDDGAGKKTNGDFFHSQADCFMQRDVGLPDELDTSPVDRSLNDRCGRMPCVVSHQIFRQ
jgi:hypothetical protein